MGVTARTLQGGEGGMKEITEEEICQCDQINVAGAGRQDILIRKPSRQKEEF